MFLSQRTIVLVAYVAFASASSTGIVVADEPVQALVQGWTADDRDWFYYTSQGSRLMPYKWFMALERADDSTLFRDNAFIESMGYLRGSASVRNPDALPIGFVKDIEADFDLAFKLKTPQIAAGMPLQEFVAEIDSRGILNTKGFATAGLASLRPSRTPAQPVVKANFPKTKEWLGLTCAACHTAKLETKTSAFYVDGGSTNADFSMFLENLVLALNATLDTGDAGKQKFRRFADSVLGNAATAAEVDELRQSMIEFTSSIAGLASRSRPTSPYGPARLDAFGILTNEIVGTAMALPENWRKPDAPVSYPFLWLTPELDWVQWNGSAHNPLARNVGEVLGVFADLNLADPNAIVTSAKIRDLNHLEEHIKKLQPPKWPDDLLGPPDATLLSKGAELYKKYNCAECHELPPYSMTMATQNARALVEIKMIPISRVGTDPIAALSFLTRSGKTGIFKTQLGNKDEIDIPTLLGTAVGAVIGSEFKRLQITPEERAELLDHRISLTPTPEHLGSYKARPLAGVWATAPFLHNGSVASLHELLLPAKDRLTKFRVGSRKYDTKHVGYVIDQGSFEFDTNLSGNANTGHEFGTEMSDEEREQLVEYLKTL